MSAISRPAATSWWCFSTARAPTSATIGAAPTYGSRRVSARNISRSRSPITRAPSSPSSRSRTGNSARMTPGRLSLGLAIALLAAVPDVWAARNSNPDKLPSIRVQDLHYGDVLFHFWADEDAGLAALTRLEAYNHWQRMPHHALHAQLLRAGLYL